MRTDTVTTEVFTFSELSDDAKQTAIENNHDINTDYEWYDFNYEDAKQIGEIMGIDIDRIYFSGFSSQGDGACFEGSYSYEKGSVKNLKEYAPKDEELHRIAQELQDIQRKHFYGITANVKHSGHYSHKYCTQINVDSETQQELPEDEICEVLRDYMEWIYRSLEKSYDYLTSDESISETLEANEYEFTADGNRY